MLIRAGASNRTMVEALGVNINRLFLVVFALGAAMAGLAGMLIAPITEASIGMGNDIIIVAFVVVIVGGIGSVKGAFYAAMIIGLIDTLSRSYLDVLLGLAMPNEYCGNRGAGVVGHADLHPDGRGACVSPAGPVSPGWNEIVNWLPRNVSTRVYVVLLLILALAPFIFEWIDQPFYLDLLSRALILVIAVVSLNLILGFGGMVSLGHAAYIGIGAYCVGIPSYYDFYNGWLHLALALSVSAAFALLTGAISLRTKGVYFIMITMAFSQMVYFTFLSLEEYGADDGLVIYSRSEFPGVHQHGQQHRPVLLDFCSAAGVTVVRPSPGAFPFRPGHRRFEVQRAAHAGAGLQYLSISADLLCDLGDDVQPGWDVAGQLSPVLSAPT